jgi:AcrR family transcriptional regulator
MLAEALARTTEGVTIPQLVIEGIVGGIAHVSKSRLISDEVAGLSASSGELIEWALSYPDASATQLAKLDQQSVWRDTTLEPRGRSAAKVADPWSATGDRAMILATTAELATKSGYSGLAAARVRSAARVSRRTFDAYFDDLEDCYLAAIEQRVGEAMAQAARAQAAARDWPGGVHRAIAALCDHIAEDQFLARVCLTDDFPPGPNGILHRKRLTDALLELLSDQAPPAPCLEPSHRSLHRRPLVLFHHHLIRDWSLRRQISATLTYLALAPVIGAIATVAAIQGEQYA